MSDASGGDDAAAQVDRALEALGRFLDQHQPAFARELRPGVDDAALAALDEGPHPLRLPPELRALYRWHDPPGSATQPFEGDDVWLLLALDELAAARDEVADRQGDAASPWLPFLRNGGGDYLCVVTGGAGADGEEETPPGTVVEVPHDAPPCPRFPSFEAWLTATVAGLERGLLQIEEDGGLLPEDPFGWEAFLRERNPGYPVGDPAPKVESGASPPGVALLRKAGTSAGGLAALGLMVIARVFRRQIPRAGFTAVMLAFVVAGLFLGAAQLLVWRHQRSQQETPPLATEAEGEGATRPAGRSERRPG